MGIIIISGINGEIFSTVLCIFTIISLLILFASASFQNNAINILSIFSLLILFIPVAFSITPTLKHGGVFVYFIYVGFILISILTIYLSFKTSKF